MRKVAIIGGGAVALSSAALLAAKGNDVRIWSAFADERDALAASASVTAEGALAGTFPLEAASSAMDCIRGADVVMIAVPAFAHRAIAEAVVPCVEAGQPVVMHSATAVTSLMFAARLARRNVSTTMIDLGTTVCMSRRTGPTSVRVAPLKAGVDLATMPASERANGIAIMASLFGPLFRGVTNALAISLNNHNAIYHVPAFLFSLANVENGSDWNLWGNSTPRVARMVERLDEERLAVTKAFAVEGVPVAAYLRGSLGIEGVSLVELFAAAQRRRPDPTGPKSIDDRYITEDVPFGLGFFLELGRLAEIDMPVTSQLMAFLCTVFERDFQRERISLDELGIRGLEPAGVVERVEQGFM